MGVKLMKEIPNRIMELPVSWVDDINSELPTPGLAISLPRYIQVCEPGGLSDFDKLWSAHERAAITMPLDADPGSSYCTNLLLSRYEIPAACGLEGLIPNDEIRRRQGLRLRLPEI